MLRTLHIRVVTACCLVAALGATAAPAHASATQTTFFEAPTDLLNAARRPAALAQMQSMGVHALRVVLYWRDVAPSPNAKARPSFDATNPASYNWGQYDALISSAQALGWQVLLTVTGPVPRWATPGGMDHLTRPDPLDYQQFMTAVGRHYGSYVKLISIWNEPNVPLYLLPQYVGGVPASPWIYRGLFEAGYAGLKASGANFSGMKVLMGETEPVGNAINVAPLTFLRMALCLNTSYKMLSTCSMLPAAGYAHHPYSLVKGPLYNPPSPNDVTIGVLGRLVTALNRAAAAGAVRPGLPIYVTEFGIQSNPPDPYAGVPLATQAEYWSIAAHIAYRIPRVVSFSQYLLRDNALPAGKGSGHYAGFFTGLEFSNGRKKPAYAGFELPMTVTRGSTHVSFWGFVRPTLTATKVAVQTSDGGRPWRTLMTRPTNPLGYWSGTSAYVAGRRWRVVWTSPAGGGTLSGPTTRAYNASGTVQR
jgi:hypothetical protein